MRIYIALLVVCLTAAGCPVAQSAAHPVSSPHGNADAIGQDELKTYLYFLASDQLEGRNFPSRGFDMAALYVASHLAEWGLKPGGSTSGTNGPLQPYFIPIELESRQLLPEESKATVTILPPANAPPQAKPQVTSFDYDRGWYFGMAGSLVQHSPLDVSANLVFAGNGWVIRKSNADPYKGIDVRGKIVVVAGMPPELAAGPLGEACVDSFSPQQYAARNGALAVVSIANSVNAAGMAGPKTARPPNPNGPPFVVKKFHDGEAGCPSAPMITAGIDLTNQLFLYERHNGAEIFYIADKNASIAAGEHPSIESFALSERKTLKLRVAMRTDPGHGENVVGILEGTDPILKNEYVVLSAHLDHLGLAASQTDGRTVFSGADDDASGSAALLAAAHAYAAGADSGIRPKRSILFLWNGGEEKLYAGSRYFVQFPSFDLARIVALVHMDMVGRTKNPNFVDDNKSHLLVERGEVLLIGPNVMSDDLERTIETVNGGYQKLKLNHFYDATRPDETHDNLGGQQFAQHLFSRSDHYNFARMGIPVVYFTTGLHGDYHRPSDTPERIDFTELEMVARTAAAVGWELGNQSQRPKLNSNLPDDLKRAMEFAQKQGWGKVTPVPAPLPGMPF